MRRILVVQKILRLLPSEQRDRQNPKSCCSFGLHKPQFVFGMDGCKRGRNVCTIAAGQMSYEGNAGEEFARETDNIMCCPTLYEIAWSHSAWSVAKYLLLVNQLDMATIDHRIMHLTS